jgi:hypothetical protein
MTDKKELPKSSTVKNNECRLVPHRFTDDEMQRKFPMATFEYEGLAVHRGDEYDPVAYLCMELPPGPACTLHLWIPKENRSKENIEWLVEAFYSDLHPWVKSKGKDFIVVNCPYDLVKTKELFRTFGFDPVPIWLGVMPVN